MSLSLKTELYISICALIRVKNSTLAVKTVWQLRKIPHVALADNSLH